MLLNSKSGRFESLNVVTGRAVSFVRAANKLAVVLIFVAVETMLKRERFLKVAAGMASQAIHRLVLTFERIFGLRVVKALVYRLQRDSLPAGGVVTGLQLCCAKLP